MLVSHCSAYRIRLISAIGAALFLLALAACRAGAPVVDPSPKPPRMDGTISGTVRGPEGTSSIEGRQVTVINTETGERQSVTTNNAGGFTFKVKPGKYRVELALHPGESFLKRPGIMDIDKSDVDAHADFVVGSGHVAGRRFAAPKVDTGLGSPRA
jgi:hypothetical protein